MRRLVVTLVALCLAIAAGTLFMAVAGLAAAATRDIAIDLGLTQLMLLLAGMAQGDGPDAVWSVVALAFWLTTVAVLVLPAVVTAVGGELFGTGSFVFYSGGSALIATAIAWLGHAGQSSPRGGSGEPKLLLLVFLTGAVSGLVYWALAGRHAARLDRPLPPAMR